MVALRLTEEQSAERSRRRQARLDRSVTDVAEDIRRERREHNRLYIRAVANGSAS